MSSGGGGASTEEAGFLHAPLEFTDSAMIHHRTRNRRSFTEGFPSEGSLLILIKSNHYAVLDPGMQSNSVWSLNVLKFWREKIIQGGRTKSIFDQSWHRFKFFTNHEAQMPQSANPQICKTFRSFSYVSPIGRLHESCWCMTCVHRLLHHIFPAKPKHRCWTIAPVPIQEMSST